MSGLSIVLILVVGFLAGGCSSGRPSWMKPPTDPTAIAKQNELVGRWDPQDGNDDFHYIIESTNDGALELFGVRDRDSANGLSLKGDRWLEVTFVCLNRRLSGTSKILDTPWKWYGSVTEDGLMIRLEGQADTRGADRGSAHLRLVKRF